MRRSAGSALVLVSATILGACTSGATTSPVGSPPPATVPSVGSSPAASGPTTVAMGAFHRVDADATGTVALEHLADGSFAVVFEDFKIDSAQHTNVILVPNADVAKDRDVDQTKILDLGPLTGTAGMQDYKVPAEMSGGAMGYHAVVLWDTAMKHAIAAAPLALK